MRSRIALYLAGFTTGLALGGCSDAKTTEPAKPVPPLIVAVSEISQQGIVDHEVASIPTVRVVDKLNVPVAGAHVVFSAGGVAFPAVITGSDGLASVTWRLSKTAGTQSLEARLYSADMAPLMVFATFIAIAVPDTLAALRPASIGDQLGFASQPVSSVPIVVAVDEFSNAKPGIEVTFAVTGGGSITPSSAVTDGLGRAIVTSWTLGGNLGTDTLIARVGNLPPVYFTARVTPPFVAKAISSGLENTCAIALSGDVYCWGSNTYGEVNPQSPSMFFATPQRVRLPAKAVSISGGYSHTCAISDESPPQAYCWGLNSSGQLGTTAARGTAPVRVPVLDGLASVTTGAQHSCGLTPAGVAYCWGYGNYGQLGSGDLSSCSVQDSGAANDCPGPKAVAGNLRFIAIAAGGSHTCGLVATGQMYCWGLNTDGQLGAPAGNACNDYDYYYYYYYNNYPVNCAPAPQPVLGVATYTSLASGFDTCALTTDGGVACTGSTSGPQPVQSNVAFTKLAPGASCGIRADGAAYCWKKTFDAPAASFALPVPVLSDLVFSTITAAQTHQCGLLQTGTVVCWGSNDAGQLGNGSQIGSLRPSFVLTPPPPSP